MQKSHIVLGVAAVLVVIGVASVRSSGTAPDANLAAPLGSAQGTVLVTYSDRGFTPAVIRIYRGTSVRFINTSGKALRITPHTDAAFSTVASKELVASKSIKLGDSFEISVVNPGVWGYTNLNNKDDVGVVIVE